MNSELPVIGKWLTLSNGTALVGAPYDNVGSPVALINQGSAYVFVLDSTPPTPAASFIETSSRATSCSREATSRAPSSPTLASPA